MPNKNELACDIDNEHEIAGMIAADILVKYTPLLPINFYELAHRIAEYINNNAADRVIKYYEPIIQQAREDILKQVEPKILDLMSRLTFQTQQEELSNWWKSLKVE